MNAAMPKSKAKTAYGLLSEIRRLILVEPRRLDMGVWITPKDQIAAMASPPACGTVGCIAGWAIALKGTRKHRQAAIDSKGFYGVPAFAIGQRILGLDDNDAQELFTSGGWFAGAPGSLTYARAVAKRIRSFQIANKHQLRAKRLTASRGETGSR